MGTKWSVAVMVVCAVSGNAALHAQKCIGQIAFGNVPINLSANMHMVSQGRGFEGRIAAGGEHAFGGISGGTIEYDHGDKSRSYIVGSEAGYTLKLGSGGPAVCPLVSVNYENGPDNIVIAEARLRAFAGVSMGGAARLSETLSFVSFVGGGFSGHRYSSKTFNESDGRHFRSSSGTLMGGVGLQSRESYLVRATVVLPYVGGNSGGEAPAYFVLGFTVSPSGIRASR